MNKLGVPTAKDVDALIKRVDDLAAAVAKLSKGGAAPTVKRGVRAPVKSLVKAPVKAATPKPRARAPRKAAPSA